MRRNFFLNVQNYEVTPPIEEIDEGHIGFLSDRTQRMKQIILSIFIQKTLEYLRLENGAGLFHCLTLVLINMKCEKATLSRHPAQKRVSQRTSYIRLSSVQSVSAQHSPTYKILLPNKNN